MQELGEKFQEFKNYYSGENSPERMRAVIEDLQKENFNLKQTNDSIMKLAKHNETKSNLVEGELKENLMALNSEIKSISTWVENYFTSSLDKSIEVPDIQQTSNSWVKLNTSIDQLKSLITTSRKLISSEILKNDATIKELRKENITIQSKNESLAKEISSLKNDLLKKIDEQYNLNQELQKYSNEMSSIQKEEYKAKNELYDKTEQQNKFLDRIYDKLKLTLNSLLDNPKIAQLYHDPSLQMTFNDNKTMLIEHYLERIKELLNLLVEEYESSLKTIDQTSRYKVETEKLRKEVIELKKNIKEENDRFLREKNELSKKLEKQKIEEVLSLENNLKQNQDRLKQKLVEKEEEIEQLQLENNLIRNQLDLLDKNLNNYKSSRSVIENDAKEKLERLQESYKILDKKYLNLLRDIELKDMQVKSQENIISRKEKEIEDMKKFEGGKIDESLFAKKLQILENEKEKLVKENLSLMNQNSTLSSQAKSLKDQLHTTMNNNIKSFQIEEDIMKDYEQKIKDLNNEVFSKENLINQLAQENKRLMMVYGNSNNKEDLDLNTSQSSLGFNSKQAEPAKGTIFRKKK